MSVKHAGGISVYSLLQGLVRAAAVYWVPIDRRMPWPMN